MSKQKQKHEDGNRFKQCISHVSHYLYKWCTGRLHSLDNDDYGYPPRKHQGEDIGGPESVASLQQCSEFVISSKPNRFRNSVEKRIMRNGEIMYNLSFTPRSSKTTKF